MPRAKKITKPVVMPDETPAGFAPVTPTVASTATEVKTKVVSKTALAIATAFLGAAAIAAGLVSLPSTDPMYGYNNNTCWDSDYTIKNDAGMPLFRYSFVNQATKGTAYGIKTGTSGYFAGTDQCWNDKRLLEFFCDVKNNKVTWNSYNCAAGTSCVDGACVKPAPVDEVELSVKLDPESKPAFLMGDYWGYGNYIFEAESGSKIVVKKLRLKPVTDSPGLTAVGDYQDVYLSTNNGWTFKTTPSDLNEIVIDLPDTALVIDNTPSPVTGTSTPFAKLNFAVKPWSVTPVGSATPGHIVGYKIVNPIEAVDLITGKTAKVNYTEAGNYFFLHKSYPTIQKQTVDTLKLTNGVRDLYKFKIAANDGDVGLYKFSFQVVPTGVKVSSLELYDVTYSGNEMLVGQLNLSSDGVFWETTGKDWTTNYSAGEITVAKKQLRIFVLRGTVMGATTGSAISTSLVHQPASVIMNKPWTTASGVNGAFVWSDKSNAAHSVDTADWTDGTAVNGPGNKYETVAY